MQHRHMPPREAAGVDITANVNLRMVKPEDCAISPDGHGLDHVVQAISNRLSASLRDEAIWQYHLSSGRGLVLWDEDDSFRYLEGTLMGGSAWVTVEISQYEPTSEALVLIKQPGGVTELMRIEADGVVTPLWMANPTASARPDVRSESDS
jgi:hypothetical protein